MMRKAQTVLIFKHVKKTDTLHKRQVEADIFLLPLSVAAGAIEEQPVPPGFLDIDFWNFK